MVIVVLTLTPYLAGRMRALIDEGESMTALDFPVVVDREAHRV